MWAFGNRWRNLTSARLPARYDDKILLVLTLVIGAVVGVVVVAFIVLTENLGARMYPAGGAAWRRVLIPIIGSLVAGILLYRYFPNARGSGIPQTKAAFFLENGRISFRTVCGKFICSALSLGSGIALGREGPSVQVGAGIASVLGRRLGLRPTKIRQLIPVGTSAAIAAAFNTPISAVLFTLEEIMGDLNAPVLGSVVIGSATAWIVLRLLLGDEPLFHVPTYQLVHPIEFAIYAVLGLVGGLVSVAFVKLLLISRGWFLRQPKWSRLFQPTWGGVVTGLIGWFVPEVLGVGYAYVSRALNGQMTLQDMAILIPLKLVSVAICYASGNAGGIFGPALFIGAVTGGAVGGAAHYFLPDYTASVGAYALVGMGAAFAGIVRAPITSVLMIFEITRDYSIIVPVMLTNLVSLLVSSRLQPEPIYEALLEQDGIHLPETRKANVTSQTTESGDIVEPQATGARLLSVAAFGLGLLGLAGFLISYQHGRERDQIQTAIQQAQLFVQDGDHQAASDNFRRLLSITHDQRYRLALAEELAKLDRVSEARVYLEEYLRANPSSGPAHLDLARIAAAAGQAEEMTAEYQRAIYGSWPDHPAASRVATHLEFADALMKAGSPNRASAELLAALDEAPPADSALRTRIGQALLADGAAKESDDVFRKLIRTVGPSSDSYDAEGEADLALGNIASARDDFRDALRYNPQDEVARERAMMCDEVLALDPTALGLKPSERYARSRSLLEQSRDSLDGCLGGASSEQALADARALIDEAKQALARQARGDVESNLSLATELWKARTSICGAAKGQEALDRVFRHLAPMTSPK